MGRLTRHQHILLRLGLLIALAEGAAAFARRAQRAASQAAAPKAVRSLRAKPLAAASRVYARGAALTIATDAVRLVAGADDGELGDLEQRLDLPAIYRSQRGLLADMQAVADALYARKRRDGQDLQRKAGLKP